MCYGFGICGFAGFESFSVGGVGAEGFEMLRVYKAKDLNQFASVDLGVRWFKDLYF